MIEDMDCKRFENDLALFVGGELDARTGATLRAHVARCAACEAEVARLRASRAAMRAGFDLSQARVPDLWPALRARLLEEGALRAPLAPAAAPVSSTPVRRMPRWMPLSAAAALLLAVGLWMAQPPAGGPVPEMGRVAKIDRPITVKPVLRRLAPGESALSDSATTTEELQDEARRIWNLNQPGSVQTASQKHRYEH